MPTEKRKNNKLNIGQSQELKVLRKIVEITNSELDLTVVLKEVVGVMTEATKADSVFIYLFDEIICGDNPDSGSKMNGEAFSYALSLSQFPASQHLYVGDRKKSDILPAKEKGMKTVSVWSQVPEADFSVPTINSVGGLLL